MASKTVTYLIDDLDQHDIPQGQGRTIEFSFDGTSYTIDLSDKNAAAFEKAVAKYVEAATRTGRAARGSVTAIHRGRKNEDVDNTAVRKWAESNGYEVSARGRIKAEVIEAFRAANA